MKRRQKGFTMIEFLAVIVILGILSVISIVSIQGVIAKAKDRYYKSQKDNMVMATQSYLNNNKKKIPKISGQSIDVFLYELLDSNYIDKVVDYRKEACYDGNSFVRVFKYEDEMYYTAVLDCPDRRESVATLTSDLKIINNFEGNGDNIQSAKTKFKITDTASGDTPKGIVSYQYRLYKDNTLIYTSDIYNAKKFETINRTVSLSDYIPSKIKISITATNVLGLSKTRTFTYDYKDGTAPECQPATGESTEWATGTRTISVGCSDGNGSGCKQSKFTYKFTGDVKVGKIIIEDKAGNKRACSVNVYIDNSPPVIELRAYKKKSGSNAADGAVMNSASTNNTTSTNILNVNKNSVNNWLNKSNWPNGIYFELEYKDISKVSKIEWNWNAANLPKNASNVTSTVSSSTPGNASGTVSSTLVQDGARYGEVVVYDQFNHKSVIKVNALLDRVKPQMITSGESTSWIKGSRKVTIGCSDAVSGCVPPPGEQSFSTTIKTKNYMIKDNAGNSTSKDINIYLDNTPPICGNRINESTTWTKNNRTIKVKCRDDDSKCSKDEESREFNTTTKVGKIKIADKVGNTTDCDVNAYVDKEPPIVKTSAKNAESDNLTIDLSDNIYLVGYAIQTSETPPTRWTSINNKSSFKQTFTKNTGTYYVYAKDAAGNISHKSQYVLKMNPPTCNISVSGSTYNGWYTSNVSVKMDTNGTISSKGLDTSKNSTNGKTSLTHSSNTSSVTYYGYVSNAAGSATCSKTFKVDKGPSKPSIDLNGYGAGNWTNRDVTISASTSSSFNIDKWQYSHDKSGWSTGIQDWGASYGSGHKSIASKITWGGQWKFYVRAVDVNGIASPASDSFIIRIDKTPPRYTSVRANCGNYWGLPPEHHAYVRLNFFDGESGIARRYVEWWDVAYQNSHLKSDANLGGSTGMQEDILDAIGSWQAFEHKLWDVAGNYSEWIDHNVDISGCP